MMNQSIRLLLLVIFILGAAAKESSIRNLVTTISKAPVKAPTKVPCKAPVKAPTKVPCKAPVKAPTKVPCKGPTKPPMKAQTNFPTKVGAASCYPAKRRWDELFGTKGEDAIAIILKEEPCIKNVFIVLVGTPVVSNYNIHRVRLYVDDTGMIFLVPKAC